MNRPQTSDHRPSDNKLQIYSHAYDVAYEVALF